MVLKITKYAALALLPATCLLADFSYQQTSKITGGMMAGMMRFAGVFSKQAREPIQATVAVKGNRLMHSSPLQGHIIDVDKETITEINFQKKTYSVITFAQMKQALEEMSQKLKDSKKDANQPDVQFKVSVNDTGNTKLIAGFDAKELIMKMEMEGTDPKTGNKGGMLIMTDMWLAPRAAGYEEMADFYKRMAQKLAGWAPGANMMMGRADVQKGLAQVYEEALKLKGMPVYQVTKMGFEGQPGPGQAEGSSGAAAAQPPSSTEAQAEKPSLGGALGGALGGRFGRFGGLGRKKAKEEPKPEQSAAQPAASQGAQPSGDASGALLEMVTEYGNFSSAPVDSSQFEVPAGFKQVEPEMRRSGR